MVNNILCVVLGCLLMCCAIIVRGQAQVGLVQLDKIDFDKIVNKFDYSLVKFDVSYPTGVKHKNFGKIASEIGEIDNFFMGEVRIKDYGDKTNEDLAERLNVDKDKKALPATILFASKDGVVTEVVRYGGDYSEENLRLFINSKAGVYLKLEGCIKELDTLAEKFIQSPSKEDREKILFAAESWAKEKGDEGEVYVKIMKTALESGSEAVEKEKARVEKMMENKSSDKVKAKLTRKLNVLSSFRVKDEL